MTAKFSSGWRDARYAAAMVLCAGTMTPRAARALPTAGQVTAGSATIQPAGSSLTVNQSSEDAAINWQSFSIAANQTVRFNQPNASAIILNRVVGQDASQILGGLSANGQVFILNPNGVLFGRNAQVTVGGLLASSLSITDADFMAGHYTFTGDNGTVANDGKIDATGGYVAMIGRQVNNTGTIRAAGDVALAAGERITLTLSDGRLAGLNVDAGTLNTLLANHGASRAAHGQVLLTAAAMDRLSASVVNNSGIIEAGSMTSRNGVIQLQGTQVNDSGVLAANQIAITGSDSGTVNVGGRLDAAADGATQRGGDIAITGGTVALSAAALLDVSGGAGGGSIELGGGPHGGGTLPHAKAVGIAAGAILEADAKDSGDGGTITVWSDGGTQIAGTLAASGGAHGGNGGMIETSGHELDVAGIAVHALAPDGAAGTWLLDPYNLTVTGTATTATQSPAGTYTSNAGGSNVLNTNLNTVLNGGTNVVLQTSGTLGDGLGNGDITVSSAIAKTAGGNATLTLLAAGSIVVSAGISSTVGALAVTLDADRLGGGGYVNITAPITTLGGNLTIGGGVNPLTGSAVGTVLLADGIKIAGALNAGGGNITLNGAGYGAAVNAAYGIYQTAAITTSGAGSITLAGTGGGSGTTEVGASIGANVTSATGNIAITGAGSPTGTGAGNTGVLINGGTTSTGGTGTITINGTGTGTATGGNTFGTTINAGAIVTAVNGLISVTGQNLSTGTSSGNDGIYMTSTGSTLKSTGTGSVTLSGTAGGTGSSNEGISLNSLNDIQSTGTGAVSLNGSGGGGGAGTNNYGVIWSPANAIQATGGGTISITGTGGDTGGTGGSNYGVAAATALAASGGALSITGTGGNSSGANNYGISQTAALTNSGAGGIMLHGTGGGTGNTEIGFSTNSNITTVTGNIAVTGAASAAATGSTNYGLQIIGGTTSAAGTGTVTLNGTATGNGVGGNTFGVYINTGGSVTAADGSLTVTGQNLSTGTGANNDGVFVTATGSTLQSTGVGGVSVSGSGGGTGAGGTDIGVYLNVVNAVQSTGAGALSITGTGGDAAGTGIGNAGVRSLAIAAAGGPISISGTGGNSSGGNNYGINQTGTIGTTGAGNITLIGTGGGSGVGELGFYSSANTTTATGNISISGMSSGTGSGSGITLAGGTTSTAGAGTITLNGTATGAGVSGGNNGVAVGTAAIVTAVDGLLSVTGQNASTGTGAGNGGVLVSTTGGTLKSTGVGGVSLSGVAGGTGAGGADIGVFLSTPNAVQSTAMGAITLVGTGGDAGGTGGSNSGVSVIAALAAAGGALSLTGTGGNSSGTANYGIKETGAITNSGTGSITLNGTGAGSGNSEIGYYSTANTTTGTGNLAITGASSALGTGSGILISGATLTSTAGNGTLTLDGTATGTATAGATSGVQVSSGAVVTAVNGLLSVTGQNDSTGTAFGNYGVFVTATGSTLRSTGTGGVTVIGAGGGAGAGSGDNGVAWDPANAIQSTASGAINISGSGGDAGGSGNGNNGVYGTAALNGGGGAINITGTPSTSSGLGYGIYLDSVAAGSGGLTLTTTGAVLSTDALTAATLTLLGAGGSYVLNDVGNAVTVLAANTGAVTYSQSGSLIIGSVGSTAGIAATGLVSVTTLGDLTIAAASPVVGVSPALAAGGAFINQDGPSAVTAISGNWLIYSADVGGDTFGALNSNDAAIWDTPANQAGTPIGNHYVFMSQPTLTFSSTDAGKVYGIDDSMALASNYAVTGLQSVAGVFADTAAAAYSGAPSLTSGGSGTNASVAGSPYAITAAAGTLLSIDGYAFAYASPGNLTVSTEPLPITATAVSRVYGATNPTLTYTIGGAGLAPGDSLTGLLADAATAASNVGAYAITQGSLAASPDYALTFTSANLNVTPAAVSVTANGSSRTYGAVNQPLTYTSEGLLGGGAFTGALVTAATPNSNVGTYAITQGSLTAGANYAITFNPAALAITTQPLTIAAADATKVQGNVNPTLSAAASGFVNGNSFSSLAGALDLTTTAVTASPVGSYAITPSGYTSSNYQISYVNGVLTVTAGISPVVPPTLSIPPVVPPTVTIPPVVPPAESTATAANQPPTDQAVALNAAVAVAVPWQSLDSTPPASSTATLPVAVAGPIAATAAEPVAVAAKANRCASVAGPSGSFRIIDTGMRLGVSAEAGGTRGCSP